ncbi:MAG: DUF5615 family PIN-like protein [Bacteroidota bacterium]
MVLRLLVDECTGPGVARWLAKQGHDVISIYDACPGISDDAVLARAVRERRILITNDKDFGEMVYREKRAHHGIVLLRPGGLPTRLKTALLSRVLKHHAEHLEDRFVVVTERQIRFAPR